jgi:hypothetical protein
MALGTAVQPGQDADGAASAESDRATQMQRYVVSATRVEKNPWRYASVPGFEVLSRASEHDTDWMLDALRRGMWLENRVMPKDWLPQPLVPYTVIVDDTDIGEAPESQIHSRPTVLQRPVDALTWGELSEETNLSVEAVGSHDGDTTAINNNVHGVNTNMLMDSTMSMERLGRCTPPLPGWLVTGLAGRERGVFREAFALMVDEGSGAVGKSETVRRAAGPGTLWVSLKETQRVLKVLAHNPHDPSIEMLPLRLLFSETPPSAERLALWESEAALFVRWGLLGSGWRDPAESRAFLELVRRARQEPVTEKVFTDCFGYGYSVMERKLASYLGKVLAEPAYVDWDMPPGYLEPLSLKAATSDQIGRILGDWLRMKGDFLRGTDPKISEGLLGAAGRMLERAYREDNGLPPDVDASRGAEHSASTAPNAAFGSAVVMKPFVVAAERIHDPRLLAVYGLYEHDIGNDTKARELLEAAVRSKVVRPAAYSVLAQLRYAEAIGKPAGLEGKLSAQQAASVLELLRGVLQGAPSPEAYNMIIDTWNNCETRPSEADVDEIIKGVELFPRDTDLAYNSALLCSQSGYTGRASRLIDKGLVFTTHEMNKEYFEQLRSTLGEPLAK